jgi:hypothetical protein
MTDQIHGPRSWAPWFVPAGVGVALGLYLGAQLGSFDDNGGFFSASFGFLMTLIVVAGVGGIVGLVLAVVRSTRQFGLALLVVVVTAALALPIGSSIGAATLRPSPAREQQGTLEVAFSQPGLASTTVAATCGTIKGGGTIAGVRTVEPFRVGIDRVTLALNLAGTTPAIEIVANRFSAYSGTLSVAETDVESRTGHGTFAVDREMVVAGRSDPTRDGLGTPVVAAVIGSVSWQCTDVAEPTPDPRLPIEPGRGRVVLRGLVVIPACPTDALCPVLGDAEVGCPAATEPRLAASEVVVPWSDGRRARLRFEPGQNDATLTVEVSDGAPALTLRAPTTVFDVPAPNGYGFGLTATFVLPEGELGADVTWTCPFEGG